MGRKRAFTLIELLVVISIIALLMAILMPALGRVKNMAKAIVCQARMKEWGNIFNFYTSDNDGNFNSGWDVGETTLWMNAMRPYYKDNWDMLLCPMASREVLNSSDFGTYKASARVVAVPGGFGETSHRYVFSYGINSWTNKMRNDRGARLQEWFWGNVNTSKGIYNVPVFGDSTWHDGWPLDTDAPLENMDAFGAGDKGNTGEMNHYCLNRHDGAVNMLFMDWSTRHVGLKELWTLKWHRQFNIAGPYTRAGGFQQSQWPVWLRDFKEY